MMRDRAFIKSAISSGYSIFFLTSTHSIESEDNGCNTETSLSSVYDKILIDLEILHQATSVPDLNDIKVVDFTDVHDILEPKYPMAAIT